MPRTKLPKTAKRNRDNAKEEHDNRLREMEIQLNVFLSKFTDDINAQHNRLDEMFDEMLQLPDHILNMKLADVKKLNVQTYEEMKQHTENIGRNANLSTDSASAAPNRASTDDELNGFQIVRKSFREDEGYLTEETTRPSTSSTTSSLRAVGPLSSALRSRRRSNSASSYLARPLLSIQKSNTGCKLRTPCQGMSSQQQHMSRTKFRTPAQNRLHTMSADRNNIGLVTPKISNDASPLAILRYQKLGETVISLGGSPIIPSYSAPETAIISIPTGKGMFALKPNTMRYDNVAEIADSIDSATLLHLKKLHENLGVIFNNIQAQ